MFIIGCKGTLYPQARNTNIKKLNKMYKTNNLSHR